MSQLFLFLVDPEVWKMVVLGMIVVIIVGEGLAKLIGGDR